MYAINHLCFSPDGNLFLTCNMDKSKVTKDAGPKSSTQGIDRVRHAGRTSVNKLLWTDYQDQIVSCSDDRTLSVWKLGLQEIL